MYRHRLVLSITLGTVCAFGLLLALGLQAIPVQAQPASAPEAPTIDHHEAISEALAYLQTKQLPNGSIEGLTGEADEFTTIKTVIALAAANYPIGFLTSVSNTTPLGYLETQAYSYTHDVTGTLFPGRTGMLIAATVAGNGDAHAFGQYPTNHGSAGLPIDLAEELEATHNPATGAYSTTAQQGFTTGAANTTNQLWAILGLAAVQETVPASATDFLIELQESDGGWGWGAGYGDVDTTALVIQALIASGNLESTAAEIRQGLDFLRNAQAASGGWEAWGSLSADSTAAAIQAAAAAGYVPATASWATANGRTPHDDLAGLQAPDGSFSGNALGTVHAIAGLAEAPLPRLSRAQRANRALTWMDEQQNGDGSWSFFGLSDPGATCDAALAYAAAGFDPYTVKAAGVSAMDYLSATASSFIAKTADSAGKLALTVEAAGGDAYDFGSANIVDVLTNTWYSPTLGAFGVPTNTYHQAFAILGLAAAGESVAIPVSATQTLIDLQLPDGGWSYDLGSVWTAPDNTGLALQALTAAGIRPTHTAIVSGVAYLRSQQDAMGGWGNANSTAYAIQGLLAVGEDVATDWVKNGRSPYEALIADQKSDGPFRSAWFGGNDNGFATWQAVPALLGSHYPFPATSLVPFDPVDRGPDPDRLVAAPLRATWGNSVDVVMPFGSDLNSDGSAILAWRASGETTWMMTTSTHRADGYFTVTLPVTDVTTYELQVTFEDPDGVQYGGGISGTASLPPVILEPHYIYLPIVVRNA
jgi:prenyltransferase beta subunit